MRINTHTHTAYSRCTPSPLPEHQKFIYRYSRHDGTCNICKRAAVIMYQRGLLNVTTGGGPNRYH